VVINQYIENKNFYGNCEKVLQVFFTVTKEEQERVVICGKHWNKME